MDDPSINELPDEEGISAEEIDAQYRRAVEAMDDADWGIDVPEEPHDAPPVAADEEMAPATDETDVAVTDEAVSRDESEELDAPPRFTPPQILEAALFVGGKPLTSKKLASLLGGSFDSSGVQSLVDELNHTYAAEGRPYEIHLGEGGYSLTLREAFARVRNRVFGVGPREVKLSQDALEVLAFVAYQQPVTREETEETGKKSAGSLLSQLVRRQLVEIHRDEDDPKKVTYHTSPRFLSVFGIGSLDELPMADALERK